MSSDCPTGSFSQIMTRKPANGLTLLSAGVLGALTLATPPAWGEAPALGTAYTSQNDFNTYFTDRDSNLYVFSQSEVYLDGGIATGSYNQTSSQLTGTGGRPKLAEGSGLAAYQNTLSGISQAFYLTSVSGVTHVEEVWGPQNKHADLTVETHGHDAESGSSLVGFIDNCAASNNLFYVGGDHHVHLLHWTQGHGWSTADVTQLAGSSVEVSGVALAGHEAYASEEIFFVGKDKHVHEFWQWSGCSGSPAPDGWHDTDLNEANQNGAPDAGKYSPLVEVFDNSLGVADGTSWLDAVFYVDANNHLRELFLSNNLAPVGEWQTVDVTAQSGAPAVVARGALASLDWYPPDSFAATESVFFIDDQARIWEVSSSPGNDSAVSWSSLNVTAITGGASQGAVAAIGGSPLTADENDLYECTGCTGGGFWNQEEIKYVGTDHHVHILGYLPGNYGHPYHGWQAIDMTAGSGAPNATP